MIALPIAAVINALSFSSRSQLPIGLNAGSPRRFQYFFSDDTQDFCYIFGYPNYAEFGKSGAVPA